MTQIARSARARRAGRVSVPDKASRHHPIGTRTVSRARAEQHSRIGGMEAPEIEQIIIRTLRELDHPRVREVQAFRDLPGSDRTGVRVTDSDGSRGFIQVVD